METRIQVLLEKYNQEKKRLERKIKECKMIQSGEKGLTLEILKVTESRHKAELNIIKTIISDLEWVERGE